MKSCRDANVRATAGDHTLYARRRPPKELSSLCFLGGNLGLPQNTHHSFVQVGLFTIYFLHGRQQKEHKRKEDRANLSQRGRGGKIFSLLVPHSTTHKKKGGEEGKWREAKHGTHFPHNDEKKERKSSERGAKEKKQASRNSNRHDKHPPLQIAKKKREENRFCWRAAKGTQFPACSGGAAALLLPHARYLASSSKQNGSRSISLPPSLLRGKKALDWRETRESESRLLATALMSSPDYLPRGPSMSATAPSAGAHKIWQRFASMVAWQRDTPSPLSQHSCLFPVARFPPPSQVGKGRNDSSTGPTAGRAALGDCIFLRARY